MKHFSGLVATLAACGAALFGAGGEWQAFVTSIPPTIPGAVTPIGLSSYVQGNFVGADEEPTSIAITPDGRWALVTCDFVEEITVLALTESPITTYTVSTAAFGHPTNIGITPDGKRAVIVFSPSEYQKSPQFSRMEEPAEVASIDYFLVATLDLTTSPFTLEPSTIQVPAGDSLAITPDSKRALVGSNRGIGGLTVLDLSTTPISIDTNFVTGFFSGGMAITPDGTKALSVVSNLNAVSILDLTATPNPVQINTLFVGKNPFDIAITPDGKRALVTCVGSADIVGNTPGITVLDLTTTPVSVETLLVPLTFSPGAIAIEPDGKKAVVTTALRFIRGIAGEEESAVLRVSGVRVLDLTTSPISVISTPPLTIQFPTDVAITPDQAPTARFTFERDGDKVTFDASSSTSPIGSIATYHWKFGDGHKKTTTSPIVTHTYHDLPKAKSHKGGDKPIFVTLTVTNTAGTSTEVIFTGRTVSNNGGPSAVCRHPLIASPQEFIGTIKMGHGKKHILLKTRWTKSPTKGVESYEIFANDTKIASISAKDGLHKTIRLHHLPEQISDTALQNIVGPRYRIRAVVDDKVVSPFVSLTVVQ